MVDNKKETCYNQRVQYWCAGFLPSQGVKARGIGYEVEMAPTLRCGFIPGVLIRGRSKNIKSLGCSEQTHSSN